MNSLDGGVEPISARAGVGLKSQHFHTIVETQPDLGWFECHPENYMGAGGPMHHYLELIRQQYPLSLHGVGLSLGSAEGLDLNHLKALKQLIERYQPALVSEHLSWSHFQGVAFNDLLPVPYTHECLAVFCRNLEQAQSVLQRQLLIENPSSYLEFEDSDYLETDFLVTLARRSGAMILLDVNNVYVSACNHGFDAKAYIERIPAELIAEIHLAGHSVQAHTGGEIRIDDHGSPVAHAVWDLYQFTLQQIGKRPTLIEWDTHIPPWPELYAQAQQAEQLMTAMGMTAPPLSNSTAENVSV